MSRGGDLAWRSNSAKNTSREGTWGRLLSWAFVLPRSFCVLRLVRSFKVRCCLWLGWQPLKPAILVSLWDPGEGCILGLKSVWQTSFCALTGQLHCLASLPVTHTEKLVASPIFGETRKSLRGDKQTTKSLPATFCLSILLQLS